VLAVPVLDRRLVGRLRSLVDELVTLAEVDDLRAVGYWYRRFEPVADAEVLGLLAAARPLRV
jgi:predicted phosphoribosyltransferase